MRQVVELPSEVSRLTLRFDPEDRWSDEQYWAFCEANPDLNVERTAQGEIVIVPPASGESDNRNAKAIVALGIWSERDGRGEYFGSSVHFLLPDGAGLSPDAAWASKESLRHLTKSDRRKYLRLSPEFVIEVLSPSDRLSRAKKKMENWIRNGVQLGWLIDGDAQTVYIYRAGQAPEARRGIQKLAGEGPVAGFVLDLTPIWRGLGS